MSIYEQHLCQVYWGSHGCHDPRNHDGDHHCGCGAAIRPDGRDTVGSFQWDMYGPDVPDDWCVDLTITFDGAKIGAVQIPPTE